MKFNGLVVIVYSIIVLLGGLIGYLRFDSAPSLIFGSISGAILFASALGIFKKSIIAFFSALTVSALLTIFFSMRYYTTMKLTPAGWMAFLSLLVFTLLISTKISKKI